jgi:hypothetical protein
VNDLVVLLVLEFGYCDASRRVIAARDCLGCTYLDQRTGNGVTVGETNRRMLRSGEAGDQSNDGSLCEHVDGVMVYYAITRGMAKRVVLYSEFE